MKRSRKREDINQWAARIVEQVTGVSRPKNVVSHRAKKRKKARKGS